MEKMKDKGRLWLKCRNCGHKWYPDARRWRDTDINKVTEKILHCPKCQVKNKVPKEALKYLIFRAKRETIIGKGNEIMWRGI